MGIQFAIHTYGYHDAMFYVLNGIKMIMNSDFTDAVIKLMGLIATSYYALRGISLANAGSIGTYFFKTMGMLTIITALLMPKADMLVVDRVTHKKEIISGLPYAFVLPVGILEAFGAGVTSLFEQAFATVSSAPFKDYGMIFGQRLVHESKNWRITDPEFIRNMDVFLERCGALEAMIGYRFTPPELMDTPDIFTKITKDAGTFRKVDFSTRKGRLSLTCREAGVELKKYLQQEMSFLSFKYKMSDFALAGGSGMLGSPIGAGAAIEGSLNKLLARNLKLSYGSALGVENKAEDIIRQNMMINAVKDFTNKSDLYAYTRASSIQNSNWAISGELAKEYLPLLLNIIKALVYASFIFLVPLMILGGGISKYLGYCTFVFSLQIWPALNSVLNLFIELYSHAKGVGITRGAITLGNFNQAHEAVDNIVLVAAFLQASIPFLAGAIVQGGVQSFVHLASSIQSASSGAASVASNEVTSGSRSFDNITTGSESISNKSGFKTDWNQLYQEGARQVQGASGEMFRSFADGSSAINSGVGTNLSSGSVAYNLSNSQDASLQQGLSNSLSSLQSSEQNYNKSKSSTISNVGDLVSHMAQRESAGETFSYDKMGEQGKALQQAVNHTKSLHDNDGYGWAQAAKAGVRSYADAGVKVPGILPVKASVGVAGELGIEATNMSNQSLDRQEAVNTSNDTNKSFNNLVKAATNEQWMKDSSIDTSYAKNTRASYDEMQSYGDSAAQKREEADTYNQALQYNRSNSASDHRDMYHEVEQGVMRQYGVSQNQAHQMIESHDPRANRVWSGIVEQNVGRTLSEVKAGRSHVENQAAHNADTFQSEHQDKVNNRGVQNMQVQAASQGLTKEGVENHLSGKKEHLQTKYDQTRNENLEQYKNVSYANKTLNDGLEERAAQYEKDRMGQGKTAAALGVLARIPTLNNSGALNIGGPNSEEKSLFNMNSNAPQVRPVKTNEDKGTDK